MAKHIAILTVFVLVLVFSSALGAIEMGRSLDRGMIDLSTMDQIVAQASQEIRLAHRRGRGRGYRRSGRRNRWVGPAVAGALIGAIIADQSYRRPRYYYRDYSDRGSYRAAKRRCARKYRSYSWRTDRYTTYSGKKKLCPYVRRFH